MNSYQRRCLIVWAVASGYFIELGFYLRWLIEGRYG